MYYSDYNRFQGHQPIETWDYQVQEPQEQPPKKKRVWPKVLAVCLVCALLAGVAGGAGWALGQSIPAMGSGGSVIYEGTRPAVVTTAQVDQTEPLTGAQIYAANVNSSVGITTEVNTNYYGQVVTSAASGSGFIITSDGYVVTNYHVIDGAKTIKVTLYNGDSYSAQLVGGDEENDVAVLKVDAAGLTPVVVGSSSELVVGEQVYAIGNPLGELTFSFTGGYVSALDRSVTMSDGLSHNYIQTDTAINSGNSGGPLFNQYGQVVGIVSAKMSSSGSSTSASVEGLGFAIPIDDVRSIITDLIQHGYITGKPYLGIIHQSVSSDAQWYGTPAGSYILGVVEGSCADKAGLKAGDIITAVNGEAITGQDGLTAAMKGRKAGDTVTLTVSRSGEELEITVTLAEKTAQWEKASQALQEKLEEEQTQKNQQQSQSGYGYGYGNGNGYGYGDSWPFGSWPFGGWGR